MIKYADGMRKKNKKQNGETRDIYITEATNEEFHFSCCNCLLSKNGNVSYRIPQSRSVLKPSFWNEIHYHNLNCFEKAGEDTTLQVAFFFLKLYGFISLTLWARLGQCLIYGFH